MFNVGADVSLMPAYRGMYTTDLAYYPVRLQYTILKLFYKILPASVTALAN